MSIDLGGGKQEPLARGVVHDLRQPIAAVGALVCLIDSNPDLPGDIRPQLEQIKSELRMMSELCTRLLDGEPPAPVSVRLDRVAREAAAQTSLSCSLAVEVDAVPTGVVGNELELRRATQNLLENACRAAGPDGIVRLIVREAADRVRLEVHDNGPGFGHSQAGSASLGLDIVQQVASDHGGQLEFGESDLGGARLTVVLPRPRHEATTGKVVIESMTGLATAEVAPLESRPAPNRR